MQSHPRLFHLLAAASAILCCTHGATGELFVKFCNRSSEKSSVSFLCCEVFVDGCVVGATICHASGLDSILGQIYN
jgi:hypothetical protein